MRVIGLSGKKRVGKDTVAAILASQHGYIRKSFAGILKDMALAIDPMVSLDGSDDLGGTTTYDHAYARLSEIVEPHGWEIAKGFPDVRRFLQRLGTEGIRGHLGDDTWVNALFSRLEPGGHYVITDCRFPNEARAVKSSGGIMLRVERPGADVTDPHPSEVALDDWNFDAVIINDGSVEDLVPKIAHVLRTV